MADDKNKGGLLGGLFGGGKAKKEAEEAAAKAKADQDKAKAEAKAKMEAAKGEAEKARLMAEAEKKKAAEAAEKERKEKAAAVIEQQKKAREAAAAAAAATKAAIEAKKPEMLKAEHTIQPGETLSHLANHFYGHASEKYWKFIMEANKEVGSKPLDFKPGKVIKIPKLPENF